MWPADMGWRWWWCPRAPRNHFALDLGLDRDDVVGALDAFGEAVERRIDLGVLGERVFVNNASLGVYAVVVQSEGYREAKLGTAARMAPELLGPDGHRADLRFVGPDGAPAAGREVAINNEITMNNNDRRCTAHR